MSFTILCENALDLPEDDPSKGIIFRLYKDLQITGPTAYEDGNQHEYDDFSENEVEEILGKVAKTSSSVGIFLDFEPFEENGIYFYSLTGLVNGFSVRFPSVFQKLEKRKRSKHLVDDIDEGKIDLGEDEYSRGRLIANFVNLLRSPVGGLPFVTILW